MFQKPIKLIIIIFIALVQCEGNFIQREGALFIQHPRDIFDIQNTWTITVRFSIQPLLQTVDKLQWTIQQIFDYVEGQFPAGQFHYAHQEAEDIALQVKVTQNIAGEIKKLIRSARPKRALLNFAGKVYQWLFGLATDDDVEAIVERLENIENLAKANAHNAIEQISLLNDTSERSFRNEQRIEKIISATKVLGIALDNLKQNFAEERNKTEAINQLFTYFRTFGFHVLDVKLELLEFLASFELLYTGKISAYFLQPSEFISTLQKIQILLPRDTQLFYPVDSDAAIYKYYTFSHTSAVMSDDGDILFLVQVPLKDENVAFNVYELKELPTKIKINSLEVYKFLNIEKQFLAISKNKKFFFTFSSLQEINCEDFDEDMQFESCKINIPLQLVKNHNCYTALFFNNDKHINQCEFRLINAPVLVIHKLQEPNSYFYTTSQRMELDWDCPGISNKNLSKEIDGSGIVTVPPFCLVTVGKYVLRGSFTGQVTIHTHSRTPNEFSLIRNELQSNLEFNATEEMIEKILQEPAEVNKEQLQTRMRLQELVDKIKSSMEKKSAQAHHYGTIGGIGVTFAFTSILGILVWFFRRNIIAKVLKLSTMLIPEATNNSAQNPPPAVTYPVQNTPSTIIVPVQTSVPAITYPEQHPITVNNPETSTLPVVNPVAEETTTAAAQAKIEEITIDQPTNFARRNSLFRMSKRNFHDIFFKRYNP